MNKLQTCLLFIIALPVIVIIGIPLFLLVFGVSFGFISSLISGIREMLLPLGCIFAAITIIGIISYIIKGRENKKWKIEKEKERERDIARFEALSTPEEYVAYYEEKLQEQREYLQRAKDMIHIYGDSYIRSRYKEITDTKRTIKRYKNMIDLP